jgi:hypothetical protein
MGIKSDKTFEEIVERLVALVRPEPLVVDTVVPPDTTPTEKPEPPATQRPVQKKPSDKQRR